MPTSLAAYRVSLGHVPFQIYCRSCSHRGIPPKEFEAHSFKAHGVNPNTRCVWCLGYTYTQRKNHVDHLIKCSDEYIQFHRVPTQKQLMASEHAVKQRTYLDGDGPELPDGVHETPWPLEYLPPHVTYRDENLNLAASYVFQFLRIRNTRHWIHIIIPLESCETFLKDLDRDTTTRTLPFSCWCKDPQGKLHRHFIVMSRRFRTTLQNFETIHDPTHLIKLLGAPSSVCKMKPYYIYKTLPACYELALAVLFEQGVERLVKPISLSSAARLPMTYHEGLWKLKLKYFMELGQVLPIEKKLVPCQDKSSPLFMYLMNGRKCYFGDSGKNEKLDDATWLQKQVEGGNCFFDNVGEELWTPGHQKQTILKYFKPAVDRILHLEAEMEELHSSPLPHLLTSAAAAANVLPVS